MTKAKAHINIGSNLGDRHALIGRAVAGISLFCAEGTELRRSGFVESEPWGFSSGNGFLNVGVEMDVCLPPDELMARLLDVQNGICASSHRDSSGGYVDRMIDIDLIFYGDVVMDTPSLVLPHPRMHLREFVLRPVAELSPEWVHPLFHLTARQLLERL